MLTIITDWFFLTHRVISSESSPYRHYDFYRSAICILFKSGLVFVGGGNDGPGKGRNYANIYELNGGLVKRWTLEGDNFPLCAQLSDGNLVVVDRVSKTIIFYTKLIELSPKPIQRCTFTRGYFSNPAGWDKSFGDQVSDNRCGQCQSKGWLACV